MRLDDESRKNPRENKRALKRAKMWEEFRQISAITDPNARGNFPGRGALVLSAFLLLSVFATIILGLDMLVPWQILFGGILGVYGSIQVIKNGFITLGWLGIIFRGWSARFLGVLYLLFYLGILVAGGFWFYEELFKLVWLITATQPLSVLSGR